MKNVDGFPRRSRINLLTPIEKMIYDAAAAIERMPYADTKLTEAQINLDKARELLADFLEEKGLDGLDNKPKSKYRIMVLMKNEVYKEVKSISSRERLTQHGMGYFLVRDLEEKDKDGLVFCLTEYDIGNMFEVYKYASKVNEDDRAIRIIGEIHPDDIGKVSNGMELDKERWTLEFRNSDTTYSDEYSFICDGSLVYVRILPTMEELLSVKVKSTKGEMTLKELEQMGLNRRWEILTNNRSIISFTDQAEPRTIYIIKGGFEDSFCVVSDCPYEGLSLLHNNLTAAQIKSLLNIQIEPSITFKRD